MIRIKKLVEARAENQVNLTPRSSSTIFSLSKHSLIKAFLPQSLKGHIQRLCSADHMEVLVVPAAISVQLDSGTDFCDSLFS